jgi:hypothetical protein
VNPKNGKAIVPVNNSSMSSINPAINPQDGPKINPINIKGNCENPIFKDGKPNKGTNQEISDKTKLKATNKLTIIRVLTLITGLSILNVNIPRRIITDTVRICDSNTISTSLVF